MTTHVQTYILLPEMAAALLQFFQRSLYTDLLTEYWFYNTTCTEKSFRINVTECKNKMEQVFFLLVLDDKGKKKE